MAREVNFDIRAQNKTDAAFNSVKKNIRDTERGFGGLKKAALGIGAAVGTLYAMAKGVETVVAAANVQRDAETKLNAVLEATGHAAGYNIKQLQDMSSAMQNVTTFGDEVTMSGMAILATFKNIRGEAFERTTRAAMDMSTVIGQDLNSSMMQLGKALNDPVKGLSALQRVGITFSEEQKKQIKQLMEQNDLMGAQAVMLAELESQFGGAATAAAGTFGGAIDQLSNTWGDLLEAIGFAITDNKVFMVLLQQANAWIASLIPKVGELVKKFADWIGPVDQLESKLATFKETIQIMLIPLQKLWSLMQHVGEFIGTTAGRLVYGDIGGGVAQYATGTGPAGLPSDGLFYGHKGEVVLNPNESKQYRGGGSGTINITIAPQFMTGDRNAARAVAGEIKTALDGLSKRWGG